MPRRGSIAKRDVLPDPLYNSKLVTRLINNIMYDGKKGVAQKIVYGAFEIIADKTGNNPLEVFEQAMENVMPVLEVKARRVGGATYQVPMEVRPERRQTLGLRWISTYSRARNERTMKELLIIFEVDSDELCKSLIDEIKKQGSWAKLGDSFWCVKTDSKNTAEIRDNLKMVIGNNKGRVFVVNITDSAWASYAIPKEVTNWIKDNS